MARKQARFDIYEAVNGWTWVLWSADGRRIYAEAGDNCWERRSDCVKAIARLKSVCLAARLEEDPAGEREAVKSEQPKGDGSYGRGGKKQ